MTEASVGTLVLHRFCGDEVYRLEKAELTATKDATGLTLCFEVWSHDTPIKTLEDTDSLQARPQATAYVAVPSVAMGTLVGQRFLVPGGYDEDGEDWVASICYCEHESLDNNEITIVAREGGAVRVHWTATTCDVNFYDGSKPATRVEIDGVFSVSGIAERA